MATVLVVEDDPNWREIMVELLTSAGHTITTADDGVQAIKQLGTQKFDIVIFDINLPRLNGIEAIRRLRRTEPDLPLLAMTANTDPSVSRAVLAAGANEVMHKSIPITEIVEIVSRYTNK
jgi:CheY-like chemotaxis protein